MYRQELETRIDLEYTAIVFPRKYKCGIYGFFRHISVFGYQGIHKVGRGKKHEIHPPWVVIFFLTYFRGGHGPLPNLLN